MAENQGFTFDELDLSIKQNNDMDPLVWLQETWQELIARFISMALQTAEEPIFGEVSINHSFFYFLERYFSL